MKSKLQKRREACERIKSSLPAAERAVVETQVTEDAEAAKARVERMKKEIAHLQSLGV